MRNDTLDVALPVGADPRQHARTLARIHDAAVSGDPMPAQPRSVIGQSWQRMHDLGIDPDNGNAPELLSTDELERRRGASGLAAALPVLRGALAGVADAAAHIMVVVDVEGRVLWRDGSDGVRRRAENLGFTEGACWHENVVGTNAIGTSLVEQRPVQVYSAEHYVRTHHWWTCAAAPLHDPRSGTLLGVVDLSGPASTVHASTLALVDSVTQLAEAQLRNAHFAELERLRTVAIPLLSKMSGTASATAGERALVVDTHGWVAAATDLTPGERVALPDTAEPGRVSLPGMGRCELEPLPGGWLVRVLLEEPATERATATLDLREPTAARLTVSASGSSRQQNLSPRHAQLLRLLAARPHGHTAAELAQQVFGDPTRTVTIRAEMSRLRRQLGPVLAHRPYRFADHIDVRVLSPEADTS